MTVICPRSIKDRRAGSQGGGGQWGLWQTGGISYLMDIVASEHLVSMQTQSSMKEAVISSNIKCYVNIFAEYSVLLMVHLRCYDLSRALTPSFNGCFHTLSLVLASFCCHPRLLQMSTQVPLQGRLITSQLGIGVGLTALDLKMQAKPADHGCREWRTKQELARASGRWHVRRMQRVTCG